MTSFSRWISALASFLLCLIFPFECLEHWWKLVKLLFTYKYSIIEITAAKLRLLSKPEHTIIRNEPVALWNNELFLRSPATIMWERQMLANESSSQTKLPSTLIFEEVRCGYGDPYKNNQKWWQVNKPHLQKPGWCVIDVVVEQRKMLKQWSHICFQATTSICAQRSFWYFRAFQKIVTEAKKHLRMCFFVSHKSLPFSPKGNLLESDPLLLKTTVLQN